MRFPAFSLIALIALAPRAQAAPDEKAAELADAVIAANGGPAFARLKRIEFTFTVTKGGETLAAARHVWDIANHSDTVSWNGRIVTVDLNAPPAEGEGREAYKRWVNDSYWLLAPLKLRDPGTRLEYKGAQEIEGKKYEVIRLSFASVGLTPGDQYDFYIDTAAKLVRRWDYMPAPGKKTSGTWDDYREFCGVKIATAHDFGDKRITFSGIRAECD
jgi:hypothetical protein